MTDAARRRSSTLLGRRCECAALDAMIAAVRTGESRVVVLCGEAGVGKTALLDYALAAAGGFQVLRAVGVQSEMELAHAALHQLCGPVLDRVDRLPGPQRRALETVFGRQGGAAPDRFLVGLAVLSLLSLVSEDRPLLCVVDDVQWLDRASAQVLGFVGRRLLADPVLLAFGTRQPAGDLLGLPELAVSGLRDADARALLAPAFRLVVDAETRDRIVAEARGNPLALLELPRGLRLDQLAGGAGLLPNQPLIGRIEESFQARIAELSDADRRLLLIAAAEPAGEPDLLWRAARRLGVRADAAAADDVEALLTIGDTVTFRHPLVRSAVYGGAGLDDRRAVHLALAEITDAGADPDRRAWHLASATVGPDDAVAAELERSAGRAQARGGLAAAAAFLQRAVALTADASLRVDRALRAAQVSLHAGEFEPALRMVAVAEGGEPDESQRARGALLRGQIAFASGHGGDAPPMLLAAANQFRRLDLDAARETYLDAWGAALFAGGLTDAGPLLATSLAAARLPAADPPRPADLLLAGLATLTTAGRRAAAPLLRRATEAFAAPEASVEDNFRWGWLTTVPSSVLWDEHAWDTINTRQLAAARRAGALARLPIDLTAMAILVAWRGDFAAADAAVAEADAVVEVTDTAIAPYGAMLLAALRGREDEATSLIDAAVEAAGPAGQGIALQYARWISAILFNGLSRYEQAFVAAQRAVADTPELFLSAWALPELIEASVMTGNAEVGTDAMARLTEAAAAADTDWALGVAARSRALLAGDAEADVLFGEAIDRLLRTRLRPELGRAHLAYGEWLRRRGRRVDARAQLRAAHGVFASVGMEAFAERARRELLATGETVRKRTVESTASDELTPQERRIALLVRDGLSNPEIGARLFLSPRTVEWHLRKVFAKLSITSRRQLRDALITPG